MALKLKHFLRASWRKLRSDKRGLALTEFAVVAPVFISLGMFGFEIAYMAITKMRVSQIALSVADNASRLGQTDNGAFVTTIREDQVSSVLNGSLIEGRSIDMNENGRIILSSLEVDPRNDNQFIHWQRCIGTKEVDSAYGGEGEELEGMGTPQITAPPEEAVMFVEVVYTYSPVFSGAFVGDVNFRDEAAFIIRDDRNLEPGLTPGSTGVQNQC
ncbi:pilus assembly protein [Qipengyuania flava]|nr:pilus assembly protein [Qipengyuania flava]